LNKTFVRSSTLLDVPSPRKHDFSPWAEQVSVRRVHRCTQILIPTLLSILHRLGGTHPHPMNYDLPSSQLAKSIHTLSSRPSPSLALPFRRHPSPPLQSKAMAVGLPANNVQQQPYDAVAALTRYLNQRNKPTARAQRSTPFAAERCSHYQSSHHQREHQWHHEETSAVRTPDQRKPERFELEL
jgi:hypothetical protein